jgi:hypothetical protein
VARHSYAACASAAAGEVDRAILFQGRALPNNSTAIQPRGLRRADAARYLGISPSHFDKQRELGAIPAPRSMLGVIVWDRQDLNALFDGKTVAADNDNEVNEWD